MDPQGDPVKQSDEGNVPSTQGEHESRPSEQPQRLDAGERARPQMSSRATVVFPLEQGESHPSTSASDTSTVQAHQQQQQPRQPLQQRSLIMDRPVPDIPRRSQSQVLEGKGSQEKQQPQSELTTVTTTPVTPIIVEQSPSQNQQQPQRRRTLHLSESPERLPYPPVLQPIPITLKQRESNAETVGSMEKLGDEYSAADSHKGESQGGIGLGAGRKLPTPPPHVRQPGQGNGRGNYARPRTVDSHMSIGPRSGIDWIIPIDERNLRRRTVEERLQPTLEKARLARDKYRNRARLTGFLLNVAIALQIILGSLTTGLSAANLTGSQFAAATTTFGVLSTLTASYLARVRGSDEPEKSASIAKELDQYLRESEAFQLDHGHEIGERFDGEVDRIRRGFEEILGNINRGRATKEREKKSVSHA
ncbi:hypothetical protein AMATHDRAFT_48228 [Amanita thiersii Skay4041]|uniref:SMODS and SLOG-associating 2TM effector domain-containing protein n=1 Tax=Amanita thiersii Skay4041 TaxID=703135 RepID=A0A2A9NIX2_9AGAR|nr:hypothetical protein AMATHDRAFT_48228 [Amanita thiersii Skay4041]